MERKLSGTFTAMVTPFDHTGEMDLEALPEFLTFQRSAGIEGMVVGGTNGEATSLSVSERERLLEKVLEHSDGSPIIAGTGAASITDAVELTRHAGDAGVVAVLVLPPFYYKNVPARGIAAYFRRVMDESSVPVLLYNIPQFSSVDITDEILDLIQDHPRLAGIKDSAGDWDRTAALINERQTLGIFSGGDRLLSRTMGAGAVGNISGGANAFPDLVMAVRRAYEGAGDVILAQARVDTAREILAKYPLIAGNKSVLAHRGLRRMSVRPPLVDLSPAQESELIGRLQEAGLLD